MRGSCQVGNYCDEGAVSVRGDCCVEVRVSRVVCRGSCVEGRVSCIGGWENGGYYEGRGYVTNVMDVVYR